MTYHKATICLNGHVLSAYEANFQKYCSKCGAETYSNCTNCHAPIRGLQDIQAAVIGKRTYVLDYYCHDCGAPYPWTQKILDNAIKLLSLDGDLDDTSKELIKNAIPELLVNTPTTPLAIANYHKGMTHAGHIIKDLMRQLLVDVVSETVKKTLFP